MHTQQLSCLWSKPWGKEGNYSMTPTIPTPQQSKEEGEETLTISPLSSANKSSKATAISVFKYTGEESLNRKRGGSTEKSTKRAKRQLQQDAHHMRYIRLIR